MKNHIIILLLAALCSQSFSEISKQKDESNINRTFKRLLEEFKITMTKEVRFLQNKTLDPLIEEKIPINFEDGDTRINATFENLNVRQLSKYEVEMAKISTAELSVSIGLKWSDIFLNTYYNLNSLLEGDFTIFGKGHASLYIGDLFIGLTLKGSIHQQQIMNSNGTITNNTRTVIKIRASDTSIDLKKFQLQMSGLLEDTCDQSGDDWSQGLSTMISEMVPELVQENQSDITALMNAAIEKFAAEKLETVNKLLEWIMQ